MEIAGEILCHHGNAGDILYVTMDIAGNNKYATGRVTFAILVLIFSDSISTRQLKTSKVESFQSSRKVGMLVHREYNELCLCVFMCVCVCVHIYILYLFIHIVLYNSLIYVYVCMVLCVSLKT